ncbi:hypothetical protein NQ176_g7747 [Zarea fungicola]|uniref:Uncharacterized protein n=1 Tax=Zarea fungicola TaxID=93591 RepID=A0ACC1MXF4_9HYPO|nr:hypothetical protein NQ176_g7747 [Lecanicillium fungicola]
MRAGAFLPWLLPAMPLVAASLEGSKPPPSDKVGPSTLSLAADIWSLLQEGATCVACQGILSLLRGIADVGDEPFVDAVQVLCVLSGTQDPDVCEGVVHREGPTVADVLRNMEIPSDTSRTLCSTILGLCEVPPVKTQYLKFPRLRKSSGRQVPSKEKPLKIVHFSDIHVDRQYTLGPNTCGSAYIEEDAPGVTTSPAGIFGDHKCDTPVDLESSMYNAINDLVPDVEFAIFTGDIVDHTIWNTSQHSNTRDINQAMDIMDKSMKRVYATIGNHEMSPVNLFPPNNERPDAGWLYRLLNYHWKKWVDTGAEKDIREFGCYAAKHPNTKLRIISVNTNMYYRKNFELYRHPMGHDPNNQLKWLARQLDFAERAHDRVFIIGHMPMGDIDALQEYSNTFDRIVNRYGDTISALFYGHTHVDHFEIHYNDYHLRTEAGTRRHLVHCTVPHPDVGHAIVSRLTRSTPSRTPCSTWSVRRADMKPTQKLSDQRPRVEKVLLGAGGVRRGTSPPLAEGGALPGLLAQRHRAV